MNDVEHASMNWLIEVLVEGAFKFRSVLCCKGITFFRLNFVDLSILWEHCLEYPIRVLHTFVSINALLMISDISVLPADIIPDFIYSRSQQALK